MISRRAFIKDSALCSAAILALPGFSIQERKQVGLQLWTVSDAMLRNPSATLGRIARIGYTSVEDAYYHDHDKFYDIRPTEFAALLKKNGLNMPSSHYRLGEQQWKEIKNTLLHGWEQAVEDATTVGLKYMVCAYLAEQERDSLDHYKRVAGYLNKAGEVCKKAGIQLCYHNHYFEFEKKENQFPYDILLEETQDDLVKMEMDFYWIYKVGIDPLQFIEKYPGRFPLWVVKDMDHSIEKSFTELGTGTIDYKKVFSMANKAGMKYFFLGQDEIAGSAFRVIKKNLNYAKDNLLTLV